MEYAIEGSLAFTGEDGDSALACRYCGHQIADAAEGDYTQFLPCYVGPATDAGPRIWATPTAYIDQEVEFRQYYCPGCYAAVRTEVVPVDHPRNWDEVLGAPSSRRGAD